MNNEKEKKSYELNGVSDDDHVISCSENNKNSPQETQTTTIQLQTSDFYFGSTLGEGAYARVVHARSKMSSADFAIKIMEKAHIKKENKVKYVMMEREILVMISHVFIIKFHFSFQDTEFLYMCMDFASGGELLSLICKQQSFKESQSMNDEACDLSMTRFYVSEIVEALQYLHTFGIIHRDLKPENILIASTGHIKIADFGTALILNRSTKEVETEDDKNNDTTSIIRESSSPNNSFVGTQDYVSPEVLSGEKTPTKACDLWALGCIIFQMLTGRSPFRAPTEYLTFLCITNHTNGSSPLEFPKSMDPTAVELIKQLLIGSDIDRLGAGLESGENGYSALKAHPFFASIVFEELINEIPPYIPEPPELLISEMRDGASEEWIFEGEATPLVNCTNETTRKNSNSSSFGSLSGNARWVRFLNEDENLLLSSVIYKRKGLFTKKRQLILTDQPRLLYVDPDKMEKKGEIPWSSEHPIRCEVKSFKDFDVCCSKSGRNYHLSDPELGAEIWVNAINELIDGLN